MKTLVLLFALFCLGPCSPPAIAQVERPFAPQFGSALSEVPPSASPSPPPIRVPLFPADDGVVRRLERIELRLEAMESKLDESLRRAPR